MLFVHLELRDAVLDEAHNLVGGSNACINVSLGRLCTHLLGCSEVATLELGEVGVGIRLDVGDILQVLALGHELSKRRVVNLKLVRMQHPLLGEEDEGAAGADGEAERVTAEEIRTSKDNRLILEVKETSQWK